MPVLNRELIPFEIELDGRLMTADSPLDVGKNFVTRKNLRYNGKKPKGVSGMTKINSTNPLDSDHQHVQNAFHFVKQSPTESHVLAQTVKAADDSAPAIVQNETAIPNTGDFTGGAITTELYTEDAAAGIARFSDAPGGQVIICDAKESLIWGGDEMTVSAALTSSAAIDTALTDPRDYSAKVMNASDDADQRLLLGGGNDSYAKLLLHMDGTDGSTTFTDTSSSGHTVTPAGAAQIDTDYSKFGTGSGYFAGIYDYLTVVDHADFDLSGGVFTIDTWIKIPSFTRYIYSQHNTAATNESIDFRIVGGLLNFKIVDASAVTLVELTGTTDIADDGWHHVAVVENGDNWYLFVDGVLEGSVTDTDRASNYDSDVYIGRKSYSGAYTGYPSWIDELRISNGIARWTSDFTPPSKAYGSLVSDFLVGSTRPLKGCKFYIPSGGENVESATLTMKEWNGNSWSTVTITDNTNGLTVAGGGTVTWSSTVDTSKIRYFEGYLLYWYNFTLSVGNVDINQITVDAPVQKCLDIWDGELRSVYAYQIFSDSNYNDYTVNVAEDSYNTGNSSTFVTAVSPATALNTLLTASEYQYIGSLERLTGIEIKIIGGQGNEAAGTMAIAYWDGSAWTDATNVIDGTAEGGITFAKSGVLTWHTPDEVVEFKKQISGGIPLYYYRLHASADFSAKDIQVYSIKGIPAQNRIANFRFPLLADNCTWLCDDVDGKRNEALRSAPNAPSGFNGTESFRIPFGDEKRLIAATVLNFKSQTSENIFDVKLFFKHNVIYGLTGYDQDSYRVFLISDTIGCVSPLTLKTGMIEIEGKPLPVAIWRAATGIYVYSDFKPMNISHDIRNFFDINEDADRRADRTLTATETAEIDPIKNEYHWMFTDGNGDKREFVLDLKLFRWFEIDRASGKRLRLLISVTDTDGNNYCYGFTDDGYMQRLENGTDFDGNSIVHTLQTGFGALTETSMYETIISYFKLVMKTKSATANEVTVTHYGDGNETGTDLSSTFDPTKAGYEFADKTEHLHLGPHAHHAFKMVMTTDDETSGFEPVKIGGFYEVGREDKR